MTSTTTYPVFKKNKKERDEDQHNVATTTVTARDEAGNTTALTYTEPFPFFAQHEIITPGSLVYNGATTTLRSTALSYGWKLDKAGLYQTLESDLYLASTTLESEFNLKKNRTVIKMGQRVFNDKHDSDTRTTKQILSGMVVPYMKTEKGSLVIRF